MLVFDVWIKRLPIHTSRRELFPTSFHALNKAIEINYYKLGFWWPRFIYEQNFFPGKPSEYVQQLVHHNRGELLHGSGIVLWAKWTYAFLNGSNIYMWLSTSAPTVVKVHHSEIAHKQSIMWVSILVCNIRHTYNNMYTPKYGPRMICIVDLFFFKYGSLTPSFADLKIRDIFPHISLFCVGGDSVSFVYILYTMHT